MINLWKGFFAMPQEFSPDGRGVYHDHFRLSITKALGDQLAVALDELQRAPLSERYVANVAERAGVYQLYLHGEFVYVGKADNSLRERLFNHLRKLAGRRNVDLADMTFSCLYVDEDFAALAPEKLLIHHHKGMGSIPWNNNGFGNKDPGRNRDTTLLKRNHFDVVFPINLDLRVSGLVSGATTLSSYLKAVKSGLPYNFRYAEPAHAKSIFLTVPDGGLSAEEAFRLLSESLPGEWQVAVLMGYVIMYQEAPTEYKSAWRYYRSGVVTDVEPVASSEEMSEEDIFTSDQ